MKTLYQFIFIALFGSLSLVSQATETVIIETSVGDITLELDDQKAPASVENFLAYAVSGFYNGTIFHRVIKDFMIQGGGFTADYERKPTNSPVKNEANNGLKNTKYSIAMARTADPHSATSQFFINTKDNGFLNFTRESGNGWGYAVIGNVSKGFEVVDALNKVSTGSGGPFRSDVPRETVIIKAVRLIAKPATVKAIEKK